MALTNLASIERPPDEVLDAASYYVMQVMDGQPINHDHLGYFNRAAALIGVLGTQHATRAELEVPMLAFFGLGDPDNVSIAHHPEFIDGVDLSQVSSAAKNLAEQFRSAGY